MKISRSRLKQIIQEEMGRIEEVDADGDGVPAAPEVGAQPQLEEAIAPGDIMIAIDAIAKILENPGVKEALLGGILLLAMQKLKAMTEEDAEIMQDRTKTEVEPEEV